jgi:uncharacterized protein
MKRWIVISDTHIPDRYEEIPEVLIREMKNCDIIVHAGDFTDLDTYKKIKALGPLKAVLGNMDNPTLASLLKKQETWTEAGFKIGLMHGTGNADAVLQNIQRSFDATYDLVIYGHAHTAVETRIAKTIYFNPGSPTDRIFAPIPSYGIIEIDKKITTHIVKL